MAVTKATYTASAPWTMSGLADLFRDAFIDAGLMTAWYDSFTQSSVPYRVLKIEHDNTKTYGSSYYYFSFRSGWVGVSLASAWNPTGATPPNVPTGTQYLDYHELPANQNVSTAGQSTTNVGGAFTPSTTSNIYLDRYTSGADNKQSWFILRQGLNRSKPFSILHKDTVLHSWLDLSKGIISGYSTISASTDSNRGILSFALQENVRRSLMLGATLRGCTRSDGTGHFHEIDCRTAVYFGVGSATSNSTINSNLAAGSYGFPLPVAKNLANPAFTTDYAPICNDLPWSPFTATKLASDLGVYMHYADNTIAYGDKFIVQSGVNEWEVLEFSNNSTVNDGASAAFLARVV